MSLLQTVGVSLSPPPTISNVSRVFTSMKNAVTPGRGKSVNRTEFHFNAGRLFKNAFGVSRIGVLRRQILHSREARDLLRFHVRSLKVSRKQGPLCVFSFRFRSNGLRACLFPWNATFSAWKVFLRASLPKAWVNCDTSSWSRLSVKVTALFPLVKKPVRWAFRKSSALKKKVNCFKPFQPWPLLKHHSRKLLYSSDPFSCRCSVRFFSATFTFLHNWPVVKWPPSMWTMKTYRGTRARETWSPLHQRTNCSPLAQSTVLYFLVSALLFYALRLAIEKILTSNCDATI